MTTADTSSWSNLAYAKLSQEPECPIAYTLSTLSETDARGDAAVLILFVNGLGLPQAAWQPTITHLRAEPALISITSSKRIYVATYDRYGQGLSKPEGGVHPNAHDIHYSVMELETMRQLVTSKTPENQDPQLLIVAHSIGVPLTRLYCQRYPGKVSAALFLDSNMANTDFVSLLPDPDHQNFKQEELPPDTNVDQLKEARNFTRRLFYPAAANPENLDRSIVPSLLPAADSPKLVPPNGQNFMLTVVGHDTETFTEESLKIQTKGITLTYIEPVWKAYNSSLLQLVPEDSPPAKGVVNAPGCGHFVQRDNPKFVAEEVVDLLRRMPSRS